MISLFKRHSKEAHADSFGAYLPNDEMWAAKGIDGKKLRKLLLGFARGFKQGEDFLETVWEEFDPRATTTFIANWEKAVGIPDQCFSNTGTIEERRRNVVVKLNSSVQTADDFVALAALFGVTVTVQPGASQGFFPTYFPFLFAGDPEEDAFTIIVIFIGLVGLTFPFTFPVTFPEDKKILIQCLFNRLKPANVRIVYI